jgi:hypothetical protein
MKAGAALLAVMALTACSDLGEFEHELLGADAKAWELCKKEFAGRVYSAPPYGEKDANFILFSCNSDVAEREGGPLFCKTNGDGTKLIEVQMSKSALKKSRNNG